MTRVQYPFSGKIELTEGSCFILMMNDAPLAVHVGSEKEAQARLNECMSQQPGHTPCPEMGKNVTTCNSLFCYWHLKQVPQLTIG